ncbi:SIR2 family protein [Herbaspirillum sp. NPDC101396]|uniref:SIR2 family protein n=1 Tax=Herbaspirillum sp. NPDC101396 TaxID=3364005 RepID=UPI003839E0B5
MRFGQNKKNEDSIDSWWNSKWWTQEQPSLFPGKCALVVGAGISMDAPTSLPDGVSLTSAILNHLLDETAASEIQAVFIECQSVIGKTIPRLEHVLDKTCNPLPDEDFGRAGDPKNLLNLFADRVPNSHHESIAQYVRSNKTWCITTNFDNCIEKAAAFQIPVHIFDAKKNEIEVLHSAHGTDWGLIKLHGTIERGPENLATTLSQLQHGLPAPMKNLLNDVMKEVHMVAVAGYSGTDHFDVNHWIRARSNQKERPKLIWISHSNDDKITQISDDKKEPNISWNRAFYGSITLEGKTSSILKKMLGFAKIEVTPSSSKRTNLDSQLNDLYIPTQAEKYLNGARLAAAIGMGQLAEEQLRLFRSKLRRKDVALNIEPGIYFARGMKKEALHQYAYLEELNIQSESLSRMKLLRHGGKRLSTVITLLRTKTTIQNGVDNTSAALVEALASALDIIEDLQRFSLFRSRFLRAFSTKIMDFLWHKSELKDMNLPIAVQGKLQTQVIRMEALLVDDDNGRQLAELRNKIHEQYSYGGPLAYNYYLIEKSTAKEEDRLSDLVEINIELASILLSAMRRRWPDGIQSVWKEKQGARRYRSDADFMSGTYTTTVIFGLLFEATRIATALQEQGLQVLIANCWIKADTILKGVSYWKPQRLYEPSFPIDDENVDPLQTQM